MQAPQFVDHSPLQRQSVVPFLNFWLEGLSRGCHVLRHMTTVCGGATAALLQKKNGLFSGVGETIFHLSTCSKSSAMADNLAQSCDGTGYFFLLKMSFAFFSSVPCFVFCISYSLLLVSRTIF